MHVNRHNGLIVLITNSFADLMCIYFTKLNHCLVLQHFLVCTSAFTFKSPNWQNQVLFSPMSRVDLPFFHCRVRCGCCQCQEVFCSLQISFGVSDDRARSRRPPFFSVGPSLCFPGFARVFYIHNGHTIEGGLHLSTTQCQVNTITFSP